MFTKVQEVYILFNFLSNIYHISTCFQFKLPNQSLKPPPTTMYTIFKGETPLPLSALKPEKKKTTKLVTARNLNIVYIKKISILSKQITQNYPCLTCVPTSPTTQQKKNKISTKQATREKRPLACNHVIQASRKDHFPLISDEESHN